MGGLVIAETALALSTTAWPSILGIICYDSPMYGLNPRIFSVRILNLFFRMNSPDVVSFNRAPYLKLLNMSVRDKLF